MKVLTLLFNYVVMYAESLAISYMIYVVCSLVYKIRCTTPIKYVLLGSISVFLTFGITDVITLYFVDLSWIKSIICILSFAITSKLIYKISIFSTDLLYNI